MHKDTLYRERRRSDSIGNDSQSGSWGHSPRQTVAADKIEGRMPQTRRIQHRNDDEGDESPSAVRIARRESISASVAVPRKIQPAHIKRLTPPKPESGFLQAAAESSGQARPRLDLTLLEARIKALSASREERLQLAGNKQSPVPSPTIHTNISALPAHSQPSKQPRVEIKADLMDHRRSLDLKGALSGPLDNARGVAEDDMTSTESRSSFEDSRSEDFQPRHFTAVQREIQSLHASLEESKALRGTKRIVLVSDGVMSNHGKAVKLIRTGQYPMSGGAINQIDIIDIMNSSVQPRRALQARHLIAAVRHIGAIDK
ncbi:hypothetical protein BGZ72_002616 [Mortierella alpina]|nr:hypothetical protein BGZ72_002616 [Mortierella alpina]